MIKRSVSQFTISYLTMRRFVGLVSFFLPPLLVLGGLAAGEGVLSTISAYYFSNMRDILAGALCIVALFLIADRGESKIYNRAANAAGLLAFGVVLFPTKALSDPQGPVGILLLPGNISAIFHCVCAGIFFFGLALISFFLFPGSITGKSGNQKIQWKWSPFYCICGLVIACSLIGLSLSMALIKNPAMDPMQVELIFETIMLWAFGLAWIVKGQTKEAVLRLWGNLKQQFIHRGTLSAAAGKRRIRK